MARHHDDEDEEPGTQQRWPPQWWDVRAWGKLPWAWVVSSGGLYFTMWDLIYIEPYQPCFHWVFGIPFFIGGFVWYYMQLNERRRFREFIASESRVRYKDQEEEMRKLSLKLPSPYRQAFLDKRRAHRKGGT